jgi:putative oxidoreductase
MELLYPFASDLQPWILFLARLSVGAVFIYYGWLKIKNLKANATDFIKMGFKPGWLFGTPVALLEFFGGILLILGVATSAFATLFALMMLVGTIWKVKVKKGFSQWSYDILIFTLCLVLITFRYSIT